jgi:hypothetical protein
MPAKSDKQIREARLEEIKGWRKALALGAAGLAGLSPMKTQAGEPAPAAPYTQSVAQTQAPVTSQQATDAMNFLQDQRGTKHVTKVDYDDATDSYVWKGPTSGKRMSMSRANFNNQVYAPYLNPAGYQFSKEKGWSPLSSADINQQIKDAENELGKAWQALSPEMRKDMLQSQRDWIKEKDAAKGADKLQMIKDQTDFLYSKAEKSREGDRVYNAAIQLGQRYKQQHPDVQTITRDQFSPMLDQMLDKLDTYGQQSGNLEAGFMQGSGIKIIDQDEGQQPAPRPAAQPTPTAQTPISQGDEITSSTNNWVVTAVRKYLAQRGAPSNIGELPKLMTINYTGTTIDGEKLFNAWLKVNMTEMYITGHGHEIDSYHFGN